MRQWAMSMSATNGDDESERRYPVPTSDALAYFYYPENETTSMIVVQRGGKVVQREEILDVRVSIYADNHPKQLQQVRNNLILSVQQLS